MTEKVQTSWMDIEAKTRQRERERYWDSVSVEALKVYMTTSTSVEGSADELRTVMVRLAAQKADAMLLARDASAIRKRPR